MALCELVCVNSELGDGLSCVIPPVIVVDNADEGGVLEATAGSAELFVDTTDGIDVNTEPLFDDGDEKEGSKDPAISGKGNNCKTWSQVAWSI